MMMMTKLTQCKSYPGLSGLICCFFTQHFLQLGPYVPADDNEDDDDVDLDDDEEEGSDVIIIITSKINISFKFDPMTKVMMTKMMIIMNDENMVMTKMTMSSSS